MLTPSTGTPPGSAQPTARSSVPSPPRLTTRSASSHETVPSGLGSDDRAMAARLQPFGGALGEGRRFGRARGGRRRRRWSTGRLSVTGRVPLRRPRRASTRRGAIGVATLVGRGLRARRKNSTFPACPVRGEGMAPMMAAPAASSAPATSPRVRRWTAGSRITPFPRDASARPASNCGLTRTTSGAPATAIPPVSAGTARRSEMNERSAVTRSTGLPPSRSTLTSRTSTPSWRTTRSSYRSRWCSWPRPTSTATTDTAPACSRQSVKPPVEAPDVEGAGTAEVEPEAFEGGRELFSPTAHEPRPAARGVRSARPVETRRDGALGDRTRHGDPAGLDQLHRTWRGSARVLARPAPDRGAGVPAGSAGRSGPARRSGRCACLGGGGLLGRASPWRGPSSATPSWRRPSSPPPSSPALFFAAAFFAGLFLARALLGRALLRSGLGPPGGGAPDVRGSLQHRGHLTCEVLEAGEADHLELVIDLAPHLGDEEPRGSLGCVRRARRPWRGCRHSGTRRC